MNSEPFQPGDSVVFLALCWAGGGPFALSAVIAAYDWINHDIPTAPEIAGALNRLLARGFIIPAETGFVVPSDVYQAFHALRRRKRKNRFVVAEAFLRENRPAEPDRAQPVISAGECANALEDYLRMAQEALGIA